MASPIVPGEIKKKRVKVEKRDVKAVLQQPNVRPHVAELID
jgi:hypothetical protein